MGENTSEIRVPRSNGDLAKWIGVATTLVGLIVGGVLWIASVASNATDAKACCDTRVPVELFQERARSRDSEHNQIWIQHSTLKADIDKDLDEIKQDIKKLLTRIPERRGGVR